MEKIFVSQTVDKSDNLDDKILKNHGCVCSSSVKFSTTDSAIEKEHPEFFGSYSYKVKRSVACIKKIIRVLKGHA